MQTGPALPLTMLLMSLGCGGGGNVNPDSTASHDDDARQSSRSPQIQETQLNTHALGGDPVSKEPRLIFTGPDGFEWNDEHRIWHSKQTRASISPAHAVGTTFQTVVNDFVADRMLESSFELLTKEIRDIDGRPTLVVHANRLNARYPQETCTVAFGTVTGCAQITAVYPAAADEGIKRMIESALLSARYEAP